MREHLGGRDSMKVERRTYLQAGARGIILGATLFNLFVCLRHELYHYIHYGNRLDEVVINAKRMSAVRADLPRRGIVGYLSDRRGEDADHECTRTQYNLIPIIVSCSPSSTEPIVIGDFRKPTTAAEIYRARKLTPLRDYGNGVMLLVGGGSSSESALR
ncbi:hypothetical protein [Pyrinomonas methylaliphatogenes]|nr:hypothetical protein [Pyrinomonas methylaliphatogenes]